MKKWDIKNNFKFHTPRGTGISNFKYDSLIDLLLENRGIKTKKDREDFLHPKLEEVTSENVGIDSKQLQKALSRIKKAIEKKEQIVVFGDYDVDGITGTAIVWETLYEVGAIVMPYIPNRIDEGYGLSVKGISNVQSQISNIKLIITVDNGIVANEAVALSTEIINLIFEICD